MDNKTILLEKLITIFNFTKSFYEAYYQNLPLDNFPIQLQELISNDMLLLVKSFETKRAEKINLWREEAIFNFDRIGKLGIGQTSTLIFDIEPNSVQDCSFIKALKIFNERNFYILDCLANRKSLEDNENLIKSQIKLSAFNNVTLLLSTHDSLKKIFNQTEHINTESEHYIKIQEKYLDRFISSLAVNTLDSHSKENLTKILQGENINEPIKFSCSANSVISFFRKMHEEGIILSNKNTCGRFIQSHFLFKWRGNFNFPKDDNIKNYLTRKEPSSVSHKIILVD